ncbi:MULTISPECIES: hypothetical protein [Nocardia]|uniref:hypothetical protein n=1 Tax=Nocardia TaxID=1817 RepID=UPI001300182B|nr:MULTISPECIES: hypothetical protein [Nocardia]
MNHTTRADHDHGIGWLSQHTEPVALQPITDALTTDEPRTDSEWQWLHDQPAIPDRTSSRQVETDNSRTGRTRVWVCLTIALAAALVMVGFGIRSVTEPPAAPTAIPTITTAPPATTAPAVGACTGLSGATITDGAGDPHTVTGVIAAFDYAYYRQRDAATALGLVSVEAGLVLESLSAGIASIPEGSTHCVAITPIADTAAQVHLVEVRPDGQRLDYLQLINARPDGPDRMVITNFQKQG